MSSEEYLADVATRHQVFIQRYGTGVAEKYVNDLERINERVATRLKNQEIDKATRGKLRQIQLDINQLLGDGYNQANTSLLLEYENFAEVEADFSASMINEATTARYTANLPTLEQMQSALSVSSFSPDGGRTLVNIEQALTRFTSKKAELVRQTVRDGIVLGDTSAVISERIQDLTRVTKAQANTISRTMTNHVSQIAREELIRRNDDVIDEVIWTATLDNRTSLICASRDQTRYPVNSNFPRPPAHYNCRSTLNFKVNPEFDLAGKAVGDRPSKGATGKKDIKANINYGQWLKKQPASFQDAYFAKFTDGDIKAKLFRKGKLPLDRFIDNDGAQYSLQELRQYNRIVIAKAGV